MRSWQIARLAVGGLRRTRLRVTLTALGVTIASAALVSMMAFALGLQRQMETPFKILGLLNDIHVSPQGGKNKAVLDDAALERMERLPGVLTAYPDIRIRGLKIRCNEKSETALAMAVPREASLLGVSEEILVAGRFFSETKEPEAILGDQLVGSLGFATPQAAIGATVTLEADDVTPAQEGKAFTFQHKQLTATVVGVYDVPMVLPGPLHRSVVLPVDLMKVAPGVAFESAMTRLKGDTATAPGTYSRANVRVHHPSDLASVEKQIQAMGFKTHTMLSQLQRMRTFLVMLEVLLGAIGSVALVVAALGIVNTLLMSVLERYQEIGICKAIGASDGDLVVLFMTEAGIIGLLGGLGGLVLGRAVCWCLELAINVYARSQGVTDYLTVFVFPLGLLGVTVLFAVVTSLVAGVYPALRAARVDPIRALRRE